jgi:transcriptional regulator with XRE-family HTH domain
MSKHSLADKLRIARAQAGLTQKELAQAAGFSRAAMSDYEVGRSEPDAERLAAIAHALGVQVSFFFPTPPLVSKRGLQVLKPARAVALARGKRGRPTRGGRHIAGPEEWSDRLGGLLWVEVTATSALAASVPVGSVLGILYGPPLPGSRAAIIDGADLVLAEVVGSGREMAIVGPDGMDHPLRSVKTLGSVVVILEPATVGLLSGAE